MNNWERLGNFFYKTSYFFNALSGYCWGDIRFRDIWKTYKFLHRLNTGFFDSLKDVKPE